MSPTYRLAHYGWMFNDPVRTRPYADALQSVVRSDSVVIDLGAGPGFFALLACKFGAKKVYAIEPDSSINLLRKLAADNGCLDRIEIIQDLSTEITLKEKADIMVSDLRGVLPVMSGHIGSIVDARNRHLKPGATLIPGSDRLLTAAVSLPAFYERLAQPWLQPGYGLKASSGLEVVQNQFHTVFLKREQMVVEPLVWASIDYDSIQGTEVAGEVSWTVDKNRRAHGLGLWFETSLDDLHGYSSSPETGSKTYGHSFLPWKEPLNLCIGDILSVTLKAHGGKPDYVWQWQTSLVRNGEVKASFNQSTFYADALLLSRND